MRINPTKPDKKQPPPNSHPVQKSQMSLTLQYRGHSSTLRKQKCHATTTATLTQPSCTDPCHLHRALIRIGDQNRGKPRLAELGNTQAIAAKQQRGAGARKRRRARARGSQRIGRARATRGRRWRSGDWKKKRRTEKRKGWQRREKKNLPEPEQRRRRPAGLARQAGNRGAGERDAGALPRPKSAGGRGSMPISLRHGQQ